MAARPPKQESALASPRASRWLALTFVGLAALVLFAVLQLRESAPIAGTKAAEGPVSEDAHAGHGEHLDHGDHGGHGAQTEGPRLNEWPNEEGELRLDAGMAGHISAEALRSADRVPVRAEVGEPGPTAPQALAVRIIGPKGELSETTAARPEASAKVAHLAISAEALSETGRYLVEIQTGEKSHFPLRRYAVDVE